MSTIDRMRSWRLTKWSIYKRIMTLFQAVQWLLLNNLIITSLRVQSTKIIRIWLRFAKIRNTTMQIWTRLGRVRGQVSSTIRKKLFQLKMGQSLTFKDTRMNFSSEDSWTEKLRLLKQKLANVIEGTRSCCKIIRIWTRTMRLANRHTKWCKCWRRKQSWCSDWSRRDKIWLGMSYWSLKVTNPSI